MTQTAPRPEPALVPVTPGQLTVLRDFLATGDSPGVIAERRGVSRNLVSQQLLRVTRAGGFETPTQLMAALSNRRARLVTAEPAPRGRHARSLKDSQLSEASRSSAS